MRSLRALTVLLVLLVLVPAGALGALGVRGAGRFEAEARAHLRRELDEAARALRRESEEVAQREDDASAERLRQARDLLLADLPLGRAAEVLARARRVLAPPDGGGGPQVVLRLLGPDGRAVLPPAFDPDAPPGPVEEHRLRADLRREAEAAWFGRHDLAAALAVWTAAEARLPGTPLAAALAVEAAWLRVRAAPDVRAAAEVERLRAAHPEAVLARAGRPWVQLLRRAAVDDRSLAAVEALRRLDGEGSLLEVPLTDEEREQVGLLVAPVWAGPGGEASAPVRRRDRLPLREGALLEVERRWGSAAAGPGAALAHAWSRRAGEPGHLVLHLADAEPPPAEGATTLEVPLPAGARAWAVLRHPRQQALWAEVARARSLTWLGVGGLLGVVLLGLLVVRTALARERAARRLQDDLLANVSHELRTPLTSVCLHADLLAEPGLDERARRAHAEVVRAEGARLAALVDDLLDTAALRRGARRLEPSPVDLGAALATALAPWRTLAAREGVDLQSEGSAEALADPQALARILANLLGNAWKHGRPSRDGAPGRIAVRLRPGAGASTGPTVEVEDDGPGIPAGERERLFERFQRGAATAGVRGAGLGLALSRDLARAMGGDLVLHPRTDRTCFRLTLAPLP